MTPQPTPESLLITTLKKVIDAYNHTTLPLFRNHQLHISQKNDTTPVTLADTQAEKEARHIISAQYPSHHIWGEENQWLHNPPSSRQSTLWILDPIDGTRSFATGNPLFGCMAGIIQQEQTILSAISFPALKEHYFSHQLPLHTSSCTHISHAKLAATSHVLFNPHEWKQFNHVAKKTALTRFGGDCYNYISLASGWLDCVIEADMAPHDFIPLIPIVKNAGGIITDWNGNNLEQKPILNLFQTQKKYQIVASATPQLHQQILNLLQEI